MGKACCGSEGLTDDEDMFNPDYVEVDRILEVAHTKDSDTGEEVTHYLVKWCSLSYEESTWELEEDVDQGKVREFEALQVLPDINIMVRPFLPVLWQVVKTDASLLGWGAVFRLLTVQGRWSAQESSLPINVLEIRAIFLSLRLWERILRGLPIQIQADNATEVAYVNHQGVTRSSLAEERPSSDSWQKLECSRTYKNNNQLREYQLEGMNWLLFNWYNRKNCILADEMGLGKKRSSLSPFCLRFSLWASVDLFSL
ncbi:unnamed protein product [Ranitomeya imitator]|uniref:Chromo domain-containing protein n=1 Tax=Ranitomeya imitator TaxID=111125 RepID=A0ABN9KTB5_9NEOB|nr:unnamed protein product [Ranitomeya imitator]